MLTFVENFKRELYVDGNDLRCEGAVSIIGRIADECEAEWLRKEAEEKAKEEEAARLAAEGIIFISVNNPCLCQLIFVILLVEFIEAERAKSGFQMTDGEGEKTDGEKTDNEDGEKKKKKKKKSKFNYMLPN
jgi:hypothetical protein